MFILSYSPCPHNSLLQYVIKASHKQNLWNIWTLENQFQQMISDTCVNTGNTLHLVKQDWIELTFYIIKGRLTPELHQICKQGIWVTLQHRHANLASWWWLDSTSITVMSRMCSRKIVGPMGDKIWHSWLLRCVSYGSRFLWIENLLPGRKHGSRMRMRI